MKHPLVGAAVGDRSCWAWKADALAQSTVTDIVSFLVTNQSIPTGDAARDRAAAEAARDTITRALLVNLTSVPIATSSSGFLYRLNPELGTVERATQSFGGFFVERAFSPGHGRATLRAVGIVLELRSARQRGSARRQLSHDREPLHR